MSAREQIPLDYLFIHYSLIVNEQIIQL